LKALVLFALCVCALGSGVFIPHMDVAFHATFDDDGDIWEGYFVQFDGQVYYTRERYDNGDTYLYRCDILTPPYQCFVKYIEDGEPDCYFEPPWIFDDVYYTPFYYETATAAACPDGVSDGCMNYTDEYGKTLTVDSRNRLVMLVEDDGKRQLSSIQVTYHDDVPTVDTFADTDCNGEALKAPTPFGTVSLKDIGCAFSFTMDGEHAEDVRGYKEGDDVKFLMVNGSGYQMIGRCDVEGCYSEVYFDKGGCNSASSPFYVLNSILPQGEFNYVGEGESVSCSSKDGPAECMKYTSPGEGGYIIVDSQNRIVVRGEPDHVVTRGLKHSVIRSHKRAGYIEMAVKYHDEEPSIDIFDNLKCNDTAFPPAQFTCPQPPPSSSSTKPVDPSSSSSSTKPVDPSSSIKPVTPSSAPMSSSSMTDIAALLVVAVIIVALL